MDFWGWYVYIEKSDQSQYGPTPCAHPQLFRTVALGLLSFTMLLTTSTLSVAYKSASRTFGSFTGGTLLLSQSPSKNGLGPPTEATSGFLLNWSNRLTFEGCGKIASTSP